MTRNCPCLCRTPGVGGEGSVNNGPRPFPETSEGEGAEKFDGGVACSSVFKRLNDPCGDVEISIASD